MKLLTGDSGLVHESALGNGEHGHTFLINAASHGTIDIDTRSDAGPVGAGRSRCACSDCNSTHVGSEFVATRFKLIYGTLVLEEYDLAETLAARLEAETELAHAHVTDVPAVYVNPAFAERPADPNSTLANRGEYRVTVTNAEESCALIRILEPCNCVAITIRMGEPR